jgi:hypothetical protein
MNIGVKTLKYFQTKFNNTLKRSLHHEVGCIPEMQEWFNIHKSISIIQLHRIKENHKIISIHAKKASTKFNITALKKPVIERIFLNIIKLDVVNL